MISLDELIASWKARRAFLSEQLERLKRSEMPHGARIGPQQDIDLVQKDIERVELWIADLNELLVQHHSRD